jgi:hypothetical protein
MRTHTFIVVRLRMGLHIASMATIRNPYATSSALFAALLLPLLPLLLLLLLLLLALAAMSACISAASCSNAAAGATASSGSCSLGPKM